MKIFDSIENLPIWNFYKVNDTSDLRYLYDVEDINQVKVMKGDKLEEKWLNIMEEYFDNLTISDDMHFLLMKKKEVAVLESKWIRTKKSIYKSLYLKAKKELDEIENAKESSSLDDQIFSIEKFMGFQVDPKKLSTKKFFTYINNINKAVLEQIKMAKQNG